MVDYHFLIVSYPGQGQINPALQFSKRLIAMGARVTFVTTLHMLRRMTTKTTIPGLSYQAFSDGFDDGLVINSAAAMDLYGPEFKRRGSEFITNLILSAEKEGRPFTCLIHTLLVPWAPQVARELNLPTAKLWIEPAAVLVILYHYFEGYSDYINEKISEDCDSNIELPGLPFLLSPCDLPSYLLPKNATAYTFPLFKEDFEDLANETTPTVLVNTFGALEAEALRAVDKLNMIPIGPLIPSAFLDRKDLGHDASFGGDTIQADASNDYIGDWLGSQAPASVVYVSFGSYIVLLKAQMEEIARALLDSGRPFLWVVKEKEVELELSCREELEGGEGNGKIVRWCSQLEVLSHPSVGCFLSHCGWNSTLESIVSGVPMVAFPIWTDQKTNAKLIQDVWKIGVRVDHVVNEDGIVEGKEIQRSLEVVMGNGDKAEEFRRNAQKWKGLAKEAGNESGPSDNNFRAFVDGVGK